MGFNSAFKGLRSWKCDKLLYICIICKLLYSRQNANIPKSNNELLYNIFRISFPNNFDFFAVFPKSSYFTIFFTRFVCYNKVDVLSCVLVTSHRITLALFIFTSRQTANVTLP